MGSAPWVLCSEDLELLSLPLSPFRGQVAWRAVGFLVGDQKKDN
jgi:hypothetical protein